MKEKFLKYSMAFAAMLILMLVAFALGELIGYDKGKASFVPETDTIVIHTTYTDRIPAPPPDTVTNTVTRYVKVPVYIRDTDTIREPGTVPLPFEQHFARLEDVADLWYSGYQAKIDSAVVYRREKTIIEQHYIQQQGPANIIGIEAGTRDAAIMYMRQFDSFYVGISAGTTYEGTATAKGIVGFRF